MKSKRTAVLLCAVITLGLVCTAQANWSDNFEDGNHTSSPTWGITGLTVGGPGGTITAAVINTAGGIGVGSKMLSISETDANVLSIVGTVAEDFADCIVSGLVADTGDESDIGLLARANISVVCAYALTIDVPGAELDISVITYGVSDTIASISIPDFSSTEDYYLVFSVIGDSLSGKIYDEVGGSLLGTVNATDSDFSSGEAGIVTNTNGSNASGYFDNVSAVPEPATMVLLAVGGLALLLRRRRRA